MRGATEKLVQCEFGFENHQKTSTSEKFHINAKDRHAWQSFVCFVSAPENTRDVALLINKNTYPIIAMPSPIAEIGSLRYQPNLQLCALAVVEQLGLLEAGRMIRVGPVHYNMLGEFVKFGKVLEMVAK